MVDKLPPPRPLTRLPKHPKPPLHRKVRGITPPRPPMSEAALLHIGRTPRPPGAAFPRNRRSLLLPEAALPPPRGRAPPPQAPQPPPTAETPLHPQRVSGCRPARTFQDDLTARAGPTHPPQSPLDPPRYQTLSPTQTLCVTLTRRAHPYPTTPPLSTMSYNFH